MRRDNQLLQDITYGAVAGMVGTVFMEQASALLYRFEAPRKKQQEEEIRDEPPYQTMARRITRDLGEVELGDEDLALLGQALHWGYGATWGVLYGVLRRRVPLLRSAAGAPFSVLFFLIGDEALNTGLKLTPPPKAYPIDAHIRGLVAHLVYTAAAEATISALEAVGNDRANGSNPAQRSGPHPR